MLAGGGTATANGNTPQSLEQLLERQWEQGSQFLMEQAQHFDSKLRFYYMTFKMTISIVSYANTYSLTGIEFLYWNMFLSQLNKH